MVNTYLGMHTYLPLEVFTLSRRRINTFMSRTGCQDTLTTHQLPVIVLP